MGCMPRCKDTAALQKSTHWRLRRLSRLSAALRNFKRNGDIGAPPPRDGRRLASNELRCLTLLEDLSREAEETVELLPLRATRRACKTEAMCLCRLAYVCTTSSTCVLVRKLYRMNTSNNEKHASQITPASMVNWPSGCWQLCVQMRLPYSASVPIQRSK